MATATLPRDPYEVAAPASVAPDRFGPAVGEAVAHGGRLLHLCRDGERRLLAVWAEDGGVTAIRCEESDEPVSRPSTHGVWSTLLEEERLARDGLHWVEPAPAADVRGHGVFTMPLGPVRGDVAESAAWRLRVMGDEILHAELRFGFRRRGVEEAASAAGPQRGLAVAERVTGTSPVAHALAYCQAWERALGIEVPQTALDWRGIFAEVERVHSHLGDLAALASATGLPVASAELLVLRESVLQACRDLTGHRYLRGALTLGGIAAVPPSSALKALTETLSAVQRRLDAVIAGLESTTTFLDRLHGTGRVPPAWVERVAPVGPVGRACGLPCDTRAALRYGPYRAGAPGAVVRNGADAWARYELRAGEVRSSLAWLEGQVASVAAATGAAAGEHLLPVPAASGDDVLVHRVEAPRGELVYLLAPDGGGRRGWLRMRPPSAVNWCVLGPAVAAGNVLQDVPIIDASFALSVAAMDR